MSCARVSFCVSAREYSVNFRAFTSETAPILSAFLLFAHVVRKYGIAHKIIIRIQFTYKTRHHFLKIIAIEHRAESLTLHSMRLLPLAHVHMWERFNVTSHFHFYWKCQSGFSFKFGLCKIASNKGACACLRFREEKLSGYNLKNLSLDFIPCAHAWM